MYQHWLMKPDPQAAGPGSLGCACANLRRVTRAVTQLYDEALRPRGLRATQFTLLQVLARRGAVTQGSLANFLATDSTTLSRTLKPLTAAGWIRGFAGGDRRERHLELTPAGRRALERATPAWEAVQGRLRKRLGERTWRALEELTTSALAAARAG
jgi:DNA-binding MarR family transcriptional regulator